MSSVIRLAVLLCLQLTIAGLAQAAAVTAPFLWEVQGPNAKHYLLGSVHLLPEASAQWPAGITEAYEAAEGVVFEADIGQLGSPQTGLALLAAAKSSKGLRSDIDAPTYARLSKRLQQDSLPPALCDAYKPWFCALSIEIATYKKAGFSGDYGLDRQLYDAAKTDGKPTRGLETVEQQVGLFSGMPDPLSRQFLSAELADGDGLESPTAVYHAWKNNDVDVLARNAADLKKQFPEVYARLLGNRNRAWMPRLKSWLDGDASQLVVVGAAHLVGPDGLVARLRARGYRVLPYVSSDPELITQAPPMPALIPAHTGALPGVGVATTVSAAR